MYEDLKGKFALVTGAASKRGMGHDIALRLAREGCIVAVNGRPGKRTGADDVAEGWEGIPNVIAEIEAMGGRAIACPADLTDTEQVEAMFEKIDKEFGRLDILVNPAAIPGPSGVPLMDLTDEDWDKVIQVNLTGQFHAARAAAKRMAAQNSGNIITISSLHGKIAVPGIGAYTSSKFGTVGMNQTLFVELVDKNVRCNCIIAGCFASDMPGGGQEGSIRQLMREEGLTEDEAIDKYLGFVADIIPMKRVGRVKEMSSVVAFLASEESSYINGQAINVDGGFLIAH